MCRGLGKLEKAIIEHLEKRGKPDWFTDISYVIYSKAYEKENYKEFIGSVPRSHYEATRRAIKKLCKKGLLESGYVKPQLLGMEHLKAMCWLPGQNPPIRRKALIDSVEVEKCILDLLRNFESEADEIDKGIIGWNSYEPDMIPYKWITWKLPSKLALNHDSALGMAINRAVKRLAEKGIIKAYWYRFGKYGVLKLV